MFWLFSYWSQLFLWSFYCQGWKNTRPVFLHNYLLLKQYLLFRVVYNGVHVQSHVQSFVEYLPTSCCRNWAFGFPPYWTPLFFWSSHCQGLRTCGLLFLHNYLHLKPHILFWVVFNCVHVTESCAIFCRISTTSCYRISTFGFPSCWSWLFLWSSHCQGCENTRHSFLHNYLLLKYYLLFRVVFNGVHCMCNGGKQIWNQW